MFREHASDFVSSQLDESRQYGNHEEHMAGAVFLVQADMPREACSNVGRDAVIVEEGHKTQTALLHAQQVADDMYHESLVSVVKVVLRGVLRDAVVFESNETQWQRYVGSPLSVAGSIAGS